MSGIGEVAYTILLGWMRGLVDWFWSMTASGGPGSIVQWFMSNWKVWLTILIVGGLVVDWLMWVVRWRPYRLLFGKRMERVAADGVAVTSEGWDRGVGFYEHETAMDSDPAEWTDLTLSTLSEIDPDWAGGVVMESEPAGAYDAAADSYYSELYDETLEAELETGVGYWAETPDELEADGYMQAAESPYYDEPDMEEISSGIPSWRDVPEFAPQTEADETLAYGGAEAEPVYDESIFMPPAPQEDAAYEEEWVEEEAGDAYDPYEASYEVPAYAPEPEPETLETDSEAVPEDTSPKLYMRTGFWPGSFPFAKKHGEAKTREEDTQPEPETRQPETGDEPHRRRRRRLRESAYEGSAYHEAAAPVPPRLSAEDERMMADTRPRRLVRPVSEQQPEKEKKRGLRTVTGKPAVRRGLLKFTSAEEEPIAGLPPLELTDPFLPAARPGSPDFEQDEGEEFYIEGD